VGCARKRSDRISGGLAFGTPVELHGSAGRGRDKDIVPMKMGLNIDGETFQAWTIRREMDR